MASSTTEIANLSLSHLGIGKEIGNLDTERSEEAAACRRFYDTARDATLRDFPWPRFTKFVTLALVETNPTDEWVFSYRYPSDCLELRRVLSGIRNDSRQSRVPYKIGQDVTGHLIYTDQADAQVEYTALISTVERYPSDFVLAFSFRLASLVAPRLTGGDPFKVGQRALELYMFEISKARATAVNEEQAEEDVDSEFVRVRNDGAVRRSWVDGNPF